MKLIRTLSLAALMAITTGTFAQSGGNEDWMSALSNTLPLHRMAVPGTHDTGAYVTGGPLIQTQTLTFEQQLTAGIRAFDLRLVAEDNTKLIVYHSFSRQGVDFQTDMLDAALRFLDAHPTETLIMTSRKEQDDIRSPKGFEQILKDILSLPQYRQRMLDFSPTMTLGEARGKILFIARNHYATPIIGATYASWSDNNTFDTLLEGNNGITAPVRVEDKYKVPTILPVSINAKLTAIQDNLSHANSCVNLPTPYWHVTYTSGTGAGAFPNAVADRVNQPIADYITTNKLTNLGIIFMDFAGSQQGYALTQSIIDANAKTLSTGIQTLHTPAKSGCDISLDRRRVTVTANTPSTLQTIRAVSDDGTLLFCQHAGGSTLTFLLPEAFSGSLIVSAQTAGSSCVRKFYVR